MMIVIHHITRRVRRWLPQPTRYLYNVPMREKTTAADRGYILQSTPRGKRIQLVRGWKARLGIGLFLLVFSSFWNGVIWIGFIPNLWNFATADEGIPIIFAIFMFLFLIPFVLIGFFMLIFTVQVLFGRNEILITPDEIEKTSRIGFLRWSRRRPQKALTGINVVTDKQDSNSHLELHFDGHKKMKCGYMYDRSVLQQVAHEIAETCKQTQNHRLFRSGERTIAVTEEYINNEDTVAENQHFTQPHDSTIEMNQTEGGPTFNLKPMGLLKGSKGLFFFSILWNGFMTAFTTFMVFGLFNTDAESLENDLPLPVLILIIAVFMLIFWGAGIGMLISAINSGKRRTIVDIVGDTLLITQSNLFGTKQMEWHRDDIAAIRMDNSGIEVNNTPVKELQIHLQDHVKAKKKKISLFRERTNDDLQWIAYELRQHLKVPAT